MRPLSDLGLSIRIALFSAFVPLLFRLPIRRLEAWTSPALRPLHPDPVQIDKVIRRTSLACRALRPFLSHPCQVRGLTLYYFLSRAGLDLSLVFGVGLTGKRSEGHCWLVKDGKPYLETVEPLEHFLPMYTFNAPVSANFRPAHAELIAE